MYTLKVNSLHYTGLPSFPRAMLIRVMALEKKIPLFSGNPRADHGWGPEKNF